ncbi:MAG TPA: hypothetical protein DIT13_15150, partial [Verrucomicrobiales bacterium]|nr:hypothetical protein [Verrucomicrobiales bacterium]
LLPASRYDSNAHDSPQLPLVLAGGGGGTLRGGRCVEFDKKDENRKLCRLHLALMERMGVKTDRFGDADNSLGELA